MDEIKIGDEIVDGSSDQQQYLEKTAEARQKITDFLQKAAKVLELFSYDEWILNKDNGNYSEIVGNALSDSYTAYLNVLSASQMLLTGSEMKVKTMAMEFQKEVQILNSSLIQEIIVLLLNTDLGKESITKNDTEAVSDFFTTSVNASSNLLENIVRFEQDTIESQN